MLDLRDGFGPAPGDGVTDETATLTAAINFATGGSFPRTLYIPGGVHLVKAALPTLNQIDLFGDGWSETVNKGSVIQAGGPVGGIQDLITIGPGGGLCRIAIADGVVGGACSRSVVRNNSGAASGASIVDSLISGSSAAYTKAALWNDVACNRLNIIGGRYSNSVAGNQGLAFLIEAGSFDMTVTGARFIGLGAMSSLGGGDGFMFTNCHWTFSGTSAAQVHCVAMRGVGWTITGGEMDACNGGAGGGSLLALIADTADSSANNVTGTRLIWGHLGDGLANQPIILVDASAAGAHVAQNNRFNFVGNGGPVPTIAPFAIQLKRNAGTPAGVAGNTIEATLFHCTAIFDGANIRPASCGRVILQ